MTLSKPEHWYVLYWTLAAVVTLGPVYYLLWRLVQAIETIEFILSVSRGDG